jgi:hypothetical protein
MVCAFVSLKRIGVADWLRVKWDEVDGLISPMTRMISDNTSFIAVGMVIQYQAEQCRGGPFSFLWLARIMYRLHIDQTSDLA